MREILVNVTPAYTVKIGRGCLDSAGREIVSLLKSERAVLVTDRTVEALYGERVRKSLAEAGLAVSSFVIQPGKPASGKVLFSAVKN